MDFKDVKAGLNKALQTLYPISSDDPTVKTYGYYGIEIDEGYDTPCFFTKLETGESRVSNKNTLYHHVVFYINYFPDIIDEIDIFNKVDAIRDLFAIGCPIKSGDDDRYIECIGYDWDFGGTKKNMLEISVDFEYHTSLYRPPDAELMKDAQIIFNGGTEDEWNA